MSLATLKRRIQVGTKLVCIQNTLRPVLDGEYREVIKVQTNGFWWRTAIMAPGKRAWTDYPKAAGITWMDETTVRLSLGTTKDGREHFVELRFV